MSTPATATLPPGLARKVKKVCAGVDHIQQAACITYGQVLEMKTESTEVLSSLDTLSTMYTTNDAASRRQLKATIEQRGIDTNRKFLHAADIVLQVRMSAPAQCALYEP